MSRENQDNRYVTLDNFLNLFPEAEKSFRAASARAEKLHVEDYLLQHKLLSRGITFQAHGDNIYFLTVIPNLTLPFEPEIS